jgi:hypothetical protein
MTNYTREIIKDLAIINLGHEHPATIEIFTIDERERDDAVAVGKMVEVLEDNLETTHMERVDEEDEEDWEDEVDEIGYNPYLGCNDWDC